MNKKTIFRILGALASSLIAVSVFVPFVNISGNLISLWQSYESLDALYLPIMIIVSGTIGIMFFSLNIKTEFAYMSSGATLFFVVMETIDILDKGLFSTLNVGYYFLVVGSILTGLMAFLTNLKSNKKEIDTVNQPIQSFTLEQIDKLYSDTTIIDNEISPIQPINNVDIPIVEQQLIQKIEPIEPKIVQGQSMQPIEPKIEQGQSMQPIEPKIEQGQSMQPIEPKTVQGQSMQPIEPKTVQGQSLQPIEQSVNVQDVAPTSLPNINENPVVKEFMTPQFMSQSDTNELDIFGQPINK